MIIQLAGLCNGQDDPLDKMPQLTRSLSQQGHAFHRIIQWLNSCSRQDDPVDKISQLARAAQLQV